MMGLQPYIGITDFTDFEQVQAMMKIFKKHQRRGSKHQLHIGAMMSYKTLHGIDTKWAKAFPPKEEIGEIFGSDETYNCLHYADYDYDPTFQESLSDALMWGDIGIRAVQLDMVWPEPAEIANAVHISRRPIEVILQIGTKALDLLNNDPHKVVERLRDYEDVIHRVLLDRSMGRDVEMNTQTLLPFAYAIRDEIPGFGIGVAGGLGPDTLHLVEPLFGEFSDLSIDAQSKLRPSGSTLDPIDWNMAGEYLKKALAMLQ